MSDMGAQLGRREFLSRAGKTLAAAGAGLSLAAEPIAQAKVQDDLDKYDFLLPRVKFKCSMSVRDRWHAFPGADRNFLAQLSSVVRCKVKLPQNCNDNKPHDGSMTQFNAVVDLESIEQMRKYPFLFMTASGTYSLSKKKKQNIYQYVHEGGFLYMDECVHGINDDGDFFYQSSYKILVDTFGAAEVKRIPNGHEIFHNVYNLGDIGLPYIIGQYHGARGVSIGERLAIFLSSTDIHCGWVDKTGKWFGRGGKMGIGKHGHKEAIQMGINIVMYAVSH